MLEEYGKTLGKKINFIVKTDETVEGFTKLNRTYPQIKELVKKYKKIYNKSKKKK